MHGSSGDFYAAVILVHADFFEAGKEKLQNRKNGC